MRDVWVPQITCPDASTVWAAGGTYTVTWDTSSEPAQVTNSDGLVYLRIGSATQSTPLAQGFPLADGHVDVTIPADTVPADDWILVRKSILSGSLEAASNLGLFSPVFGDSGNWSPPFTITSS